MTRMFKIRAEAVNHRKGVDVVFDPPLTPLHAIDWESSSMAPTSRDLRTILQEGVWIQRHLGKAGGDAWVATLPENERELLTKFQTEYERAQVARATPLDKALDSFSASADRVFGGITDMLERFLGPRQ